ncbi:MAG: peptidylprolyl isomerase [Bacteroidetes bacterium]|nr:peptidylprolyl isomerase [Bacteroidota bacterium]
MRSAIFLVIVLGVSSCKQTPPAPEYVARVGEAVLTMNEINRLLENQSVFLDSADVVSQIVEQWVTNELLFQEARDRGLRGDPEVQRLLADNERSVLINAFVNRAVSEELGNGPNESALQTYYEQHRDQLALREPFVKVRHIIFDDADSAEAARGILQRSGLEPLPRPMGRNANQGLNEEAFYPQRQLFAAIPGLNQAVDGLDVGEVMSVFAHETAFHVVQLLDRLPEGTVPSIDMIRDDIRDRVAIQIRKQLYARQVQRLRTRALAREELEIR